MTSSSNIAVGPPVTAEGHQVRTRILCLGNELLADDALGCMVAEEIRQFAPPQVEVVSTTETGFHLLDYVLNTCCLVVIDTVVTGTAAPGTVYVVPEEEFRTAPGGSPHYIGLHETLSVARKLHLPVAETVVVLAVEAADCTTLGGAMHPAVRAAIPILLNNAREIMDRQGKEAETCATK